MKYIVKVLIPLPNRTYIEKQVEIDAPDEKHAIRRGLKYFENNGWNRACSLNMTATKK